jgi:hypothetical protein
MFHQFHEKNKIMFCFFRKRKFFRSLQCHFFGWLLAMSMWLTMLNKLSCATMEFTTLEENKCLHNSTLKLENYWCTRLPYLYYISSILKFNFIWGLLTCNSFLPLITSDNYEGNCWWDPSYEELGHWTTIYFARKGYKHEYD